MIHEFFLIFKGPSSGKSENTNQRCKKCVKFQVLKVQNLSCQEAHDSRILLARDRGLTDSPGVEISLTCSVPFFLFC